MTTNITNSEIPQVILSEDIFPLYHLNYYDGPISGMCVYKGKECYFDKTQDNPREEYCFQIFEITKEEATYIHMWHRIFQLNVGLHSDYFFDNDGNSYKRTSGLYVKGTTRETSSNFFAFSKLTRSKFPEQFPARRCVGKCSYEIMFRGKGKEDLWPSGNLRVYWDIE